MDFGGSRNREDWAPYLLVQASPRFIELLYPVAHPEDQLDQNVALASAMVLAKQSFPFGKETITCWDLIYNNKYVGPSITDPSIAEIGCSTESSHFYAHFFGGRGDSAAFYETLQRITITE